MIVQHLRRYPFSILVIAAITYLSFFKPPSTDLSQIPYIDKIVHVCMYLGLSGMLWLEFLWGHRADRTPMWHAWLGAFCGPVLFSGLIELLQEYATTYRGGDWMDFLANTLGASCASAIAYGIIRPLVKSKKQLKN